MTRKIFILIALFFAVTSIDTKAFAQYKFFDGHDWKMLDTMGLPPQETLKVKTMLLKSIYETGLFNGTPMLTINSGKDDFLAVYNRDLTEYVPIIDAFYGKPDNLDFPLFFSLKIADMVKSGVTDAQIEQYRLAVIAKLTQQGLVK